MKEEFQEIWCLDFEFGETADLLPNPLCMVAIEAKSGRTIRLWRNELNSVKGFPFSLDSKSLFIAFFSSAEWGCFLSLGWPRPSNIIDFYIEFKRLSNGLGKNHPSLLEMLAHFGLPAIAETEKESMRELILNRESWSETEKERILRYCESDVRALLKLYKHIEPNLDSYSLLHGSFMWDAAQIERTGIPVDSNSLNFLDTHWEELKCSLIAKLDTYEIFVNGSFSSERFATFLLEKKIAWPHLDTGRLDLREQTFRDMVNKYPELRTLHELRGMLSKLRLNSLRIGKDGRNRSLLSPFGTITSRNTPSTSKNIFGPSSWIRFLITPPPGRALAYIDWSAEELAIAAYLSGDQNMIEAYESGDPYMAFAILANAAAKGSTKESHPEVRGIYKTVSLGVQYGMGEEALAPRIGRPVSDARELLRQHRKIFQDFWRWSEAGCDYAFMNGVIQTRFNWPLYLDANTKARTIRNFPMQGNGAEMLRLACTFAHQEGISICTTIHDAILIEGSTETIQEAIAITQACMNEASRIVLGGKCIRTDVKIVYSRQRLGDSRGETMWNAVKEFMTIRGYQHWK